MIGNARGMATATIILWVSILLILAWMLWFGETHLHIWEEMKSKGMIPGA